MEISWKLKSGHTLLFETWEYVDKGSFNNYVDKMRGGGVQKMSVFVHAQGIKTVHAGKLGVKNGKILST